MSEPTQEQIEAAAQAWDEGYSHLFDHGREGREDVVSLDDNPYRAALAAAAQVGCGHERCADLAVDKFSPCRQQPVVEAGERPQQNVCEDENCYRANGHRPPHRTLVPAPEADEREAPTCRTLDDRGDSVCDRPARFIVWGHLYEKRDKGPKCGHHLPPGVLLPSGFGAPAIYEIPARRSQPAPRTVSAAEVAFARRIADARMYRPGATVHSWGDDFLLTLGITVEPTP